MSKWRHPLYMVWSNMRSRCTNPNYTMYHYYGGRGITVCDAWRTDFWQFVADVGPRPEGVGPTGRVLYSLDRIDPDGNYEPGNVQWVTHKEQMLNTRRTRSDTCRNGHARAEHSVVDPDTGNRRCLECMPLVVRKSWERKIRNQALIDAKRIVESDR